LDLRDLMTVHGRVYLDFDGVINAASVMRFAHLDPDDPPADQWSDYESMALGPGFDKPVTFSPSVVRFTAELMERGVDVFWLTSLNRNTAALSPLGLPPIPYVDVPDANADGMWPKLEAIRSHLGEVHDGLVVWVDDEAPYKRAALSWARDAGVLVVGPNRMTGISPGDTQKIMEHLSTTK